MADPLTVAMVLPTVAGTVSAAANVVYHLIANNKNSRSSLDPASLRARTTLTGQQEVAYKQMQAKIKEEYGKGVKQLLHEEATYLFSALTDQILTMAKESPSYDRAKIAKKLEQVRAGTPKPQK